MFLTQKQKHILELQDNNRDRKIIHSQSDITVSHMHTTNSVIYKDIKESLNVFDYYYTIFERRATRDNEELKDLLLSINRRINKSMRDK